MVFSHFCKWLIMRHLEPFCTVFVESTSRDSHVTLLSQLAAALRFWSLRSLRSAWFRPGERELLVWVVFWSVSRGCGLLARQGGGNAGH